MTDVKTHPTLTVIKGHKRGDKVFRERFVNSVGDHGENNGGAGKKVGTSSGRKGPPVIS